MGGLLHLVQRGGGWAGCGAVAVVWRIKMYLGDKAGLQPAQAPTCCTKCNSPPINGQCTNHCIDYDGPLLCGFNVAIKGLSSVASDGVSRIKLTVQRNVTA